MKKILLILVFCVGGSMTFAQTKDIKCDSRKSIERHTQVIREDVYAAVINLRETKSIKPEIVEKYKTQYKDIQEGFNNIFSEMKDDLADWKLKKKLCTKYADKINTQVAKAEKFVKDVDNEFKAPVGSGAADFAKWALMIFDFIDTMVEGFAEKFYEKVEWKSWDKIEE